MSRIFRIALAASLIVLTTTAASAGPMKRDLPDIGLDALSETRGAQLGDWTLWRTRDNYILAVHANDRIAVEIVTTSNGWFRYASPRGQFVVWSTGGQDPQDLHSEYESYFTRAPEGFLALGTTEIDSFAFTVDAEGLRARCSADGETIALARGASRFRFDGYQGLRMSLPLVEEAEAGPITAEHAPTPGRLQGPVDLGALAVGEGARFGAWTLWRPSSAAVLLVQPESRVAVEIMLSSNGWFRYAASTGEFVVWSTGEQADQKLSTPHEPYFARTSDATLTSGKTVLGEYTFTVEPNGLTARCSADGETLQLRPRDRTFTFVSFRGKRTQFPVMAEAPPSEGAPAPPVENLPAPNAAPKGFQLLSVGGSARFGGWSLWRPSAGLVLACGVGSGLAVEIVVGSNGWFRYASGGRQLIVWSTGDEGDQQLQSDFREICARRVTETLLPGTVTIDQFTFSVRGDRLEARCAADGETIVLGRDAGSFTFVDFKGKRHTLPR